MSTFKFRNRYRTLITKNGEIVLDLSFFAKDDLASVGRAEMHARGVSPPPKKWNEWIYVSSLERLRVTKNGIFEQTVVRNARPALIGDQT